MADTSYTECRLCGKPRDPRDTMDDPHPCGCKYTEAMQARDILERIRGDIDKSAELLNTVIGRDITIRR